MSINIAVAGKGGTGKTTIAAAFASLATEAVLADCDVDAADLHLILKPKVEQTDKFTGLKLAVKDEEVCTDCGLCYEHCRFGAISPENEFLGTGCEGCGVCEYVCPADAVSLVDRIAGETYISTTRFGPMSHARLDTAEEASGKLVAQVRNNAREMAEGSNRELVLIDGPPGIGCPVIAAITGVDMVLVVTEPTISGSHDMERVLGVAEHFNIPAVVCINKTDINIEVSQEIEEYCKEHGSVVVGKLPYDNVTTSAMIEEKSVTEFSDGPFAEKVRVMWGNILEVLK